MFTTVARTTWCCQLIGSNQLHNCRVSRYCFFCTAKTDRALASPGNLQHTPGKKKRLKFCCELGPPKSIVFPVKQWNRQHQLSTSQTGTRGPSDMGTPTSMERKPSSFSSLVHLSSSCDHTTIPTRLMNQAGAMEKKRKKKKKHSYLS